MFFKIGECYLDTQEMSLHINEQSILLEPKVFAVLMYFIEHNDRYISMEELHENLWQGRCVSDAAVRRIISKIRIVLNDDHKEPTYLQSLPTNGYALISHSNVLLDFISLPATSLSKAIDMFSHHCSILYKAVKSRFSVKRFK